MLPEILINNRKHCRKPDNWQSDRFSYKIYDNSPFSFLAQYSYIMYYVCSSPTKVIIVIFCKCKYKIDCRSHKYWADVILLDIIIGPNYRCVWFFWLGDMFKFRLNNFIYINLLYTWMSLWWILSWVWIVKLVTDYIVDVFCPLNIWFDIWIVKDQTIYLNGKKVFIYIYIVF